MQPRHNTIVIIAALMSAAFFVAGCAVVKEYAELFRERSLSTEYIDALDEWTRKKTIYSELETRAKVAATFKSREFMKVWTAEYERIYLVDSDGSDVPAPAVEATAETTEFLLYVYASDRDAIDLARSGSAWKAVLIDAGGARYDPLEIRELQDAGPLVTEFYPYVNPSYGKIYLLKFDGEAAGAAEETKLPVTLVITSVIARAELVW
jgi:hypothetical protein